MWTCILLSFYIYMFMLMKPTLFLAKIKMHFSAFILTSLIDLIVNYMELQSSPYRLHFI